MSKIYFGDCRKILRRMAAKGLTVRTCVTSPPYFGLRDYGHPQQLGLEKTLDEYVANMVTVFRGVRDVLSDDGTLWLNLGDSYKAKQLLGVPWRVAFALQDDGWVLRQDIVWHKSNAMPESIKDRCTAAHEYLFLFSKQRRYYFDKSAMVEAAANTSKGAANSFKRSGSKREKAGPGQSVGTHRADRPDVSYGGATRNRRSVWTIATTSYKGAHDAVFPDALITPCILAGSEPGDAVLDPFMGSGTTAATAIKLGRKYYGCELNPDYKTLEDERISKARAERKLQKRKD